MEDLNQNIRQQEISTTELETKLPQSLQLERDPVLNSFYGLSGRIGILGLSGDPVTIGHIEAGRVAKEARTLDKVVYIPAFQNPLKDRQATSGEHRLNMLKLALQSEDEFYVCPMELKKTEASYTIDTLSEISGQLAGSDASLYFIAGSDCLTDLHKWKDIHKLLDLANFVTLARPGSVKLGELSDVVTDFSAAEISNLQANMVEQPITEVSSTQIRQAIQAGSIPSELLPGGVAEYIRHNGLYT